MANAYENTNHAGGDDIGDSLGKLVQISNIGPSGGGSSGGGPTASQLPAALGAGGALKTVTVQYAGTPSNYTIGTTDVTVFTISAGSRAFIQNLSATPLAVKLGASCSTSSLSYILPAGASTDDGTGGPNLFTDYVGVVSVCKMSGSTRYIAWTQAAT